MTDYKKRIAKKLSEITNLSEQKAYEALEYPKNPEMGDYSLPCFRLSKELRQSPVQIAQELQSKIGVVEGVSEVEAVSGFLNFRMDKAHAVQDTLDAVYARGERFGSVDIGHGGMVVSDYSSVNIAKPFHIGHIRSTMIGESLKRIYSFLGYRTFGINYLGDYGTQFGKLIVAIKRWGDEDVIKKDPVPELLNLYVKFHDEAEKDESLNDEARAYFVKLEQKDEEAEKIWKFCVDASMIEFSRVYSKLGVTFDSFDGERFFSDKMAPVVDELREKDLLEKSQGAEIVNLEDCGMIPAIITKSDGSSIYLTRDLASAHYRKETYNFVKNLYVTGSAQTLHFKQLFAVLEKMGRTWAKDCIHVPFGQVSVSGGKLSTRGGNVIFIEDVLEASREEISKIIDEKNPDLPNREEVEKLVGYGAVIFNELYTSREKDYIFDLSNVTNFQGETGPYVQYTHARCCSLLRKAEEQGVHPGIEACDVNLLLDEASVSVIKLLRKYTDALLLAEKYNEPHHVARFVMELAKGLNHFYNENPILTDDKELTVARITLIHAVKTVLASAMYLVCIGSPEKM